ncbi:MAG: FoF1 ATP synthase subunit a [Oscillospiraceae bacterium]
MELSVTGAKQLFEIPIFGGIVITETIVNTWIVMAAIVGICIWLTRGLEVHPTSKRQIVAEFLVETANKFVTGNMGSEFAHYVPFVATLFVLSMLSNLSSLLGFFSPTTDLSTEMAWALLVFALITYHKFKANGVGGYFKSYTKPIFVLTPFNIISEIATPISMAFRHFGNVASGSVITTLVYGALAALSHIVLGWLPGFLGQIPFLQLGLPAFLSVYFDLFSGCLQAFIFSMLTMMYIASAAETDE